MQRRFYSYWLMRWESGAWGEDQLTTAVFKIYNTDDEKTKIMTQPQQTN